MSTRTVKGLPPFLQEVIKKYPEVWEKFQDLGKTLSSVEGLGARDQQLARLGIAIGSSHEGAVHSHVRRCKQDGFTDEEIYHAALLAVPNIGWPQAMAVLSWVDDVLMELREGGEGHHRAVHGHGG